MATVPELTQKFELLWPLLDERTRRIMAASEAMSLGFGGVSAVHRASGMSRRAIAKGIVELREGDVPPAGRVRRPGAGRKPITISDPLLLEALEEMIDWAASNLNCNTSSPNEVEQWQSRVEMWRGGW